MPHLGFGGLKAALLVILVHGAEQQAGTDLLVVTVLGASRGWCWALGLSRARLTGLKSPAVPEPLAPPIPGRGPRWWPALSAAPFYVPLGSSASLPRL